MTNVSGCIVVMAKDNSPIALNAHVLCSVTESNFGDWSAGFVQDSKKVNDDWYYSVALPPSKNRLSWSLVRNVHSSQMALVGSRLPSHGGAMKVIDAPAKEHFQPTKVIIDAYAKHYSRTNSSYSGDAASKDNPSSNTWLCAADLAISCSSAAAGTAATRIASSQPMSTLVGLMPGVPQNSTFETVVQVRGKEPVASILSDRIAQKPNDPLQKRQGNKGRVHPKCPHGKRQTICLLCNGGSLCVHGKQRHWCVTCGGSALCAHKKQKSRCVHCGGSGICRHGKVRCKCSDCKTNTNQE